MPKQDKQKYKKKLKLEDVAKGIKDGKYKNIAFMVGAGISTGAGIPDFRSPETGLYANLEKLNLPYPEAVFDIDYFKRHPEAFYTLADGLYPGKFEPTKFHKFMKLIQDKGLLRRVYTQNIDTLERLAGVEDGKIVEAHGSFAKNFCIDCNAPMTVEEIKKILFKDDSKVGIPRCKNSKCKTKGGGLVKPSIVFFGEQLPKLFFNSLEDDLPDEVDLAIIAGTSLTVYPFAGIPNMVGRDCPRLLFNDESVGVFNRANDVKVLGDCDQSIEHFCSILGWDLEADNTPVQEPEEAVEEKVEELVDKLKDVDI